VIGSPEFCVGEKDEPVLKFLKSIEVKQHTDSENITLIFHFDKNEFFTNETLTKNFEVKDQEPVKASGDDIHWNEGKNVTKKQIKKKQKNKKSG